MVMLTQGQEISLFLMKYNVKVRALRIRNLPLVLSFILTHELNITDCVLLMFNHSISIIIVIGEY